MTSMREKIARAIHAKTLGVWDMLHPVYQAAYLEQADAVLDAMEEPTTQMLGAAADYSATHQHSIHGAGYWQAMITAAKEGK